MRKSLPANTCRLFTGLHRYRMSHWYMASDRGVQREVGQADAVSAAEEEGLPSVRSVYGSAQSCTGTGVG